MRLAVPRADYAKVIVGVMFHLLVLPQPEISLDMIFRSYFYCFFFSSRRRHTRFDCDWSSDVCSSDLETCVVRFTTDIPHLTNWGTPLLLGPGSILDAHTAHERISVAELAQGVDAYVRLVHALALRKVVV